MQEYPGKIEKFTVRLCKNVLVYIHTYFPSHLKYFDV